MSDTPEDGHIDYIDEIAVLTDMIDEALLLIERGSTIEMSNFEVSVSALCTRLAANPPENIEEVSQAIEGLVRHLATLSDALQAQTGRTS